MDELFCGVAIVIDDEIGKDEGIDNLIKQIESNKIPCVKYSQLPDLESINHMRSISFLLLDWRLISKEFDSKMTLDGVTHTSSLNEEIDSKNIEFLKSLLQKCFVPIFIFTNENPGNIKEKLKSEELYRDEGPNFILIKQKSELRSRKNLKSVIKKWVLESPPIYVLKEWERVSNQAKNRLFLDFYKLNPHWPQILWDTFSTDGVNMSKELGDVITSNLHSRMSPFSFNGNYISSNNLTPDKDEIRKVLEGGRFLTQLNKNDIAPGDIFKKKRITNGDTYYYYLNVRPQCDCIPRGDNELDEIKLYLIKGEEIPESKLKAEFLKKYGHFDEKASFYTLFCIDGGKTIKFKFDELEIKKWSVMKRLRIGRIIPPFTTYIQQRYCLYLERQGLPRIPEKAVL